MRGGSPERRANYMAIVPHCAFHLSVPLVFTPAAPRAAARNRKRGVALNEASPDDEVIKRSGFWRCPVLLASGLRCPHVAPSEYAAPEKKLCPRCGEKSDAPRTRTRLYDYTCINCTRKKNGYWERIKAKRKERYALTGA
jgi:hypothetical protein